MPPVSCLHCGHIRKVPENDLGKKLLCRQCKKYFVALLPEQTKEAASVPAQATVKRPIATKQRRTDRQRDRSPSKPLTNAEHEEGSEQLAHEKHNPPVFVDVRYPFLLGVASFSWVLIGWLFAALAPHLAFAPGIEVLHYLLPTVTFGLIVANLGFAVRDLWRGAHPFRLLLVTGLQIGLFTTLFFQLFAHIGARWYDVDGPTHAWQWFAFSLAHALRASDILDAIEAYNMNVQPIRHVGWLVALFVILYHTVIDVFFLGVLADLGARTRRYLLKDRAIRYWTRIVLIVGFSLWLLVWAIVALVKRWSFIDIPLWLVENVLRVLDFADMMESFDLRLHELPRSGITGTLTLLCRFWITIGIGLILGKKKLESERRLATPPDTDAWPYWSRLAGIVALMLLALLVLGQLTEAVLRDPLPRLVEAVGDDSEPRALAALAALRRMGPTATAAIPDLVALRPEVSDEVSDEITRTLGYLGADAVDPLTEIALSAEEPSALVAVESLGQIREVAAPGLVRVWSQSSSSAVREEAEDQLRQLGSDAVPPLMEATTVANAAVHYHWFRELDRNWKMRSSSNEVVRTLQQLPNLIRELETRPKVARKLAILNQMKECGTAALETLPTIVHLLADRDRQVQVALADVLLAIGPPAISYLIDRVPDPAQYTACRSILKQPELWDDATLQNPSSLLLLNHLLSFQDTQVAAVLLLGRIGPAAKHSVMSMILFLGSADPSLRREARTALTKIDPSWKKMPQINRLIPAFLPRLSSLPDEEADALIEILGDLPEADAEAVLDVLTRSVQRGQSDAAYRHAVFTAAKRMGPKLRAAAPALAKATATPFYGSVRREQLLSVLKEIDPNVPLPPPPAFRPPPPRR